MTRYKRHTSHMKTVTRGSSPSCIHQPGEYHTTVNIMLVFKRKIGAHSERVNLKKTC